MKRFFTFILTLFLCLNLFAQHRKVLFIGNSYTYVNNLPELVSNMFLSAGDTLTYEMSAPGGCTFQQHCSISLPYIQQGGWDYVVLQEQSQLPSFPDGQFMQECYPYAQQLCQDITQYNPDAHTVFYMTWGRKNGDAQNCPYFPPLCTYEGMDSLLYARYMLMAQDNHACVSPVGAVWHYIRDFHPNLDLYQSDESHPSYFGSYTAACCFYTSLTGNNPMTISWNGTLDENTAKIAKQAVKAVLYDSLSKWCFEDQTPPIDSTGISLYSDSPLSIYPNPAKQSIHISTDCDLSASVFTMYDLLGNVVLQKRGLLSKEIDVSSLNDGIYIVSLSDGMHKHTAKVTIVH